MCSSLFRHTRFRHSTRHCSSSLPSRSGVYWSRSRSVVRYLVPFVAECSLYALVLSPAVLFVTNPTLAAPGGDLLLDIGAGVYEEILFRFLILRGLTFVFGIDPYVAFFDEGPEKPQASMQTAAALILPVLVSSLSFAAYHHVGAGADPWEWSLFLFRFVAGLFLAMLYFLRGLGVCVYTHAFYDLMLQVSFLR